MRALVHGELQTVGLVHFAQNMQGNALLGAPQKRCPVTQALKHRHIRATNNTFIRKRRTLIRTTIESPDKNS